MFDRLGEQVWDGSRPWLGQRGWRGHWAKAGLAGGVWYEAGRGKALAGAWVEVALWRGPDAGPPGRALLRNACAAGACACVCVPACHGLGQWEQAGVGQSAGA